MFVARSRSLVLLLITLGCGPSTIGNGDEVGDTADTSTDGDTDAETGTGDGDGDGESTGDGDGDGDSTGDGDGDGDSTGDGDGDGDTGECASADECVLVNDCCSCGAVPIGQEEPCEDMACLLPTCDGNFGEGVVDATCFIGTCQLTTLSCDTSQITCEIVPPPECPPGTVRSAIADCWGPCVRPPMCETLPFPCDAQTCGQNHACVNSQGTGLSKCIPLPPECAGEVGCDCLAPWFGEVCQGSCGDGAGTLICEDGG